MNVRTAVPAARRVARGAPANRNRSASPSRPSRAPASRTRGSPHRRRRAGSRGVHARVMACSTAKPSTPNAISSAAAATPATMPGRPGRNQHDGDAKRRRRRAREGHGGKLRPRPLQPAGEIDDASGEPEIEHVGQRRQHRGCRRHRCAPENRSVVCGSARPGPPAASPASVSSRNNRASAPRRPARKLSPSMPKWGIATMTESAPEPAAQPPAAPADTIPAPGCRRCPACRPAAPAARDSRATRPAVRRWRERRRRNSRLKLAPMRWRRSAPRAVPPNGSSRGRRSSPAAAPDRTG